MFSLISTLRSHTFLFFKIKNENKSQTQKLNFEISSFQIGSNFHLKPFAKFEKNSVAHWRNFFNNFKLVLKP